MGEAASGQVLGKLRWSSSERQRASSRPRKGGQGVDHTVVEVRAQRASKPPHVWGRSQHVTVRCGCGRKAAMRVRSARGRAASPACGVRGESCSTVRETSTTERPYRPLHRRFRVALYVGGRCQDRPMTGTADTTGRGHPIEVAAARIEDLLKDVRDVPLWSMSPADDRPDDGPAHPAGGTDRRAPDPSRRARTDRGDRGRQRRHLDSELVGVRDPADPRGCAPQDPARHRACEPGARAGQVGARRRRAARGPGRGDHRRDRRAPRGPRPRDPLPGTDHPPGVRRRARRQSPTHPRQTDPRGDRPRDRRSPRSQGPREGGTRRRGGCEVPDVRGRPRQVPRPVHPPQHPRRDAQEGPDGLRRPQAPGQRGRSGTRTRTPLGPPDGPGVHGVRRAATPPTGSPTPAGCPRPSW